ncbi:hypothetical protein ACI2L1_40105 [Streptomyces sp. NPDC019531]|uniref:hypothetical protein n=1 Tax=Streptomyces sp. NPDC019531 TaxID=3365062 RepID=UPI00384A57D8
MMQCSAPQLTESASPLCTRLVLGSGASQEPFSSTWTWAAVVGLATLAVTTYFSVDQLRKNHRAKEAKRFQPDYDLLNETVVVLDKLAGTAAQKADLVRLCELLSRIKQAERRFPALPFGAVVAHIDTYKKTTLPDDFRRKLTTRKVTLDDLLDLSRQQGAAIAGALTAISAVQSEIDRRTT